MRFARVAITSAFGDPRNPRTWSGAPNNVALALERLGIEVVGLHAHLTRAHKMALAGANLVRGLGWPRSTEQILRSPAARRWQAAKLAKLAARHDLRHILHTGTFDLPPADLARGVKHYAYCDHIWALSLRHRPDAAAYGARALREAELLERDAFAALDHVFTFGTYVREALIERYGLSPARVTAVGSGMGKIAPYLGPKDYGRPRLLFVAKHLFAAKGGRLLLDAFARALPRRPDLTLTIVGDPRSRPLVPRHPAIDFRAHLPWEELQGLFRDATLLVQPMLNDPWGQVYLEALVSRTPVLGIARHGLPEIIEYGRHGFLIEEADPAALADMIVEAVRDPYRLARMGQTGQRHVLENYSWDRVAARIARPSPERIVTADTAHA